MLRAMMAGLTMLLLTGCADGFSSFPVSREAQQELYPNLTIISLNQTNAEDYNRAIAAVAEQTVPAPARWVYRVGVGDILSVLVYDHPELTLPAGPERSAAETGFRILPDGTFFYPFIGQVNALGRAPEEIRVELTQRLGQFITNPQIEVRVAAFNSQAINVTGAVNSPRRIPLTTTATTLIDAINAAGGLRSDSDPSRVSIQRNGQSYRVNFANFLERGSVRSNPLLGSGDTVFVPVVPTREVYVLGEVGGQATIDLGDDQTSLTQALATRGGLDQVRADARGIFVFRQAGGNINVFQLSVETPVGYLVGSRFLLQEGDVVYVTRSPRQRWNDTISGLLPSVSAVGAASATVEQL